MGDAAEERAGAGAGKSGPLLVRAISDPAPEVPPREPGKGGRSLAKRLSARLKKWARRISDARSGPRYRVPRLCAYYWDGGSGTPHEVLNISQSGAYLVAADPWLRPGTTVEMTLQTLCHNGDGPADHLEILHVVSEVVRSESGRVAVRFIFAHPDERPHLRKFLKALCSKEGVRMSDGGKRKRGQALIEFALILPLLFLLIMNLVNFGAFIYAMITVANAARTGAQYMIMGGAWVGAQVPAAYVTIDTLVKNDANALPNKTTLYSRVCKNNDGAISCQGAAPPTTPSPPPPPPKSPEVDPEPGLYVNGTVEVWYRYKPLIPGWDFPKLGIHLTLPPTWVYRRVVMRMVQ